jgi:hypothetical protein
MSEVEKYTCFLFKQDDECGYSTMEHLHISAEMLQSA